MSYANQIQTLPVSQTQVSTLPREVQRLLRRLAELWNREVHELFVDKCNTEDLIDALLAVLDEYSSEVSWEVMREGNTVAIRMADVIGNDWAIVIFGEKQCLVATP